MRRDDIPAIDRASTFVDDLGRDLRYAFRMLIKTPVLTGVTLLTLVLGIGANLAIFGIVNAVLLQPLALRQPDRLVRVFDDLPGAGAKDVGMSVPEMADVIARTDVFEQVTGFLSLSTAQRDPIGRTIRGPRGAAYRIVGVVADIHESGRDAPTIPHVYRSMLQFPTQVLTVFLRTRSDADAVREQLVGAVRDVDPELPVFAVRSMNEVMSGSIARRRFVLSLVTAFAASALLLAAMGLYGVMSFLVAHRTREFGIRLALGATPRSVAMLAARPGLTLTGAGALLGLGLSFIAARLLSTLMFGVAANDEVTFAGVVVLMFLVAIVASLIPARRATRTSPMDALRS